MRPRSGLIWIGRKEIATMREALFLPQSTLERWLDLEKVELEGQILHLFEDSSRYRLEAALFITELLDGEDLLNLIGKTCTLNELDGVLADCFRGSAVLGESAYEGEEGYVVSLLPRD